MLPTELMQEGDHLMTVCNACRYCEGYCAVWQAMERRLVFKESDLNYLANLCHNCSECYYACQYAPPHEFDINPPKTLAKIRAYTYELYAWPAPLAKAFRKNGLLVSLLTVVVLIGFLLAASASVGSRLWEPVRGGDVYEIIPHEVMTLTFAAVGLFAALALLIGFLRFWRNVGEAYSGIADPAALAKAAKDVLRLENLDNGGAGCTYPGDREFAVAALVPSPDVLWIPVVLRGHHAGRNLLLRAGMARTLWLHQFAGHLRHAGRHRPGDRAHWPVRAQAAPQSGHRRRESVRNGRVLHRAAAADQHQRTAIAVCCARARRWACCWWFISASSWRCF